MDAVLAVSAITAIISRMPRAAHWLVSSRNRAGTVGDCVGVTQNARGEIAIGGDGNEVGEPGGLDGLPAGGHFGQVRGV